MPTLHPNLRLADVQRLDIESRFRSDWRRMDSPLKKDFQYYLDHQKELVEKYNGKFVVIKDANVLGPYDTELAAITDAQKKDLKPGTFLVQFVSPGDTAYKQTFHSRVVFS